LAALLQRERVLHPELDGDAALRRLGLGPSDRFVDEVNPGDAKSARGEEQRSVARAAPGVEQRTGDLIRGRDERRLRLADVPRRDAGVGGFKGGAIGYGSHGMVSVRGWVWCDGSRS